MLHEDITNRILGCAVTVHKVLGPGLPERPYQAAMAIEMHHQGLRFVQQPSLPVTYRGVPIGRHRPDFVVEDKVVLELKSVVEILPVFGTQVLTYLKAGGYEVGLLLNFNVPAMSYGIRRFINDKSRIKEIPL
jgi:GxxExxY protein